MPVLHEAFQETLLTHHLVSPGEKVLLGVSGGPDSLALLHLFCELRKRWNLSLVVAHLDHGIRGEQGEKDAAFVRTLCEEWQLPYEQGHCLVPELARHQKRSLEEMARVARYQFFLTVAKQHGALVLALGHTADDQVETILMRFLRGSGPEGLSGMQWMRTLTAQEFSPHEVIFRDMATTPLRLVRPLLFAYRPQIEAYLAEAGLTPCQDASNTDIHFTRNRVRHELIPQLETFNPQVKAALFRMGHIFSQVDQFCYHLLSAERAKLYQLARPDVVVFSLPVFMRLPALLQWFALREAEQTMEQFHAPLAFVHFSAIAAQLQKEGAWTLHLPGPIYLRRFKQMLIFSLSPLVDDLLESL